jgi:hypothetical protein
MDALLTAFAALDETCHPTRLAAGPGCLRALSRPKNFGCVHDQSQLTGPTENFLMVWVDLSMSTYIRRINTYNARTRGA